MKRPTTSQIIWWGVGLVVGIGLFVFLRGFIACWRLTSLPGIPLPGCTTGSQTVTVPNAQGTPVMATTTPPVVSAPQVALPIPWDGASRVNILVMGLDYRDVADAANFAHQGPPRTDTMILLTIDPLTRTAGAVSIPRDLWVNIPGGFGYNKINTAYRDGELYKLPGGGAGLAMKTVSEFLGVPIHYYAWIEFSVFIKAIDRIGGVDVCIPQALTVGLYDQDGVVHLKPGCQTLNGIVALGYARNRATQYGDVDRSNRQMQVILGLRDKILSPGNWTNLVTEAPGLYQDLSSGIHTNLTFSDAIRLAALVREIPKDSINMKVIDYTMMTDTKAPDGTDILRPFTDKVRVMRDELFSGGVLGPDASGDPVQLMKDEAASVVVVNASGVNGVAAKTKDYFTSQGMNVTGFGNSVDYPDVVNLLNRYGSPLSRSYIIVHSGKPYVMNYVKSLMKFESSNQIVVSFDPAASADVIIAVGADWANNNPMK
jgi:LCP family protein required for cell wall assembly